METRKGGPKKSRMETNNLDFNPVFVRNALRVVRDPNKTAFDHLFTTDQTIGRFANEYALFRYRTTVSSKRKRAVEARNRKKRKAQRSLNTWLDGKKPNS